MQIIRQNESFLLLRRLGRGVAEVLKQAEFKRETEGMKEMLRAAKEELGFEARCCITLGCLVFMSRTQDLLAKFRVEEK